MAETLFRYGIELTAKTDHALSIRKPKLELGTVATDWSPAPEDEEELYDEISILQTQLLVVQGEISAKVWQTDIESAVNGVYESMSEQYAYLIETINGIDAQVGDVTYVVNENYTELTSLIANLQITADGIITSVSDIYSVLYGENILLNTDDMSMVAPWVDVSASGIDDVRLGDTYDTAYSEGNLTGSWTAYITDGTLPTGLTAYAIAISSETHSYGYTTTSGSMSWTQITIYWTPEDDIISDNIDKLVEGETYTFSFYLKKTVDGPIIFLVDEFFPGQTVLDVSEEVKYPSSRNPQSYRYIELDDNITNKWNKVSITFQLDSLDDFQICLPYGTKSGSGVSLSSLELYLCGLSLMSGDGSELFATKSYVGSQIEQLSDSITTTVENYQEETASQIQQLADSITATVYDFEQTMSAQIEELAGSIKLSVSSATNGSASIVMTVNGEDAGSGTILSDGVRNAFKNDTTAITISAGTVTFNSNTFIVNSTYFSVTASGVITATSGTIGGWTLTDSLFYKVDSDPDSFTARACTLSEEGLTINSAQKEYIFTANGLNYKILTKTELTNQRMLITSVISDSNNTSSVPNATHYNGFTTVTRSPGTSTEWDYGLLFNCDTLWLPPIPADPSLATVFAHKAFTGTVYVMPSGDGTGSITLSFINGICYTDGTLYSVWN